MPQSANIGRRAGLVGLIAGLMAATRASAQQPPNPNQPPAPPGPMPPGPHPLMREAERALHRARESLEHAEHDFGGHRTRAIQYVDGALFEVRTALQQFPR